MARKKVQKGYGDLISFRLRENEGKHRIKWINSQSQYNDSFRVLIDLAIELFGCEDLQPYARGEKKLDLSQLTNLIDGHPAEHIRPQALPYKEETSFQQRNSEQSAEVLSNANLSDKPIPSNQEANRILLKRLMK